MNGELSGSEESQRTTTLSPSLAQEATQLNITDEEKQQLLAYQLPQ